MTVMAEPIPQITAAAAPQAVTGAGIDPHACKNMVSDCGKAIMQCIFNCQLRPDEDRCFVSDDQKPATLKTKECV